MIEGLRVTGVVLAGGLGRRMGGVDKGLRPLRGRPMVQWVLERFSPQVDEVMINANQHLDEYAAFGWPVVQDRVAGFAGPLAGLHAALSATSSPLVATVPCDSPFLPLDLVERLTGALEQHGVDLAAARAGERSHPVFCVCRHSLLARLDAFLAGGGRKVEQWHGTLAAVEVDFDDQAEAFSNINTPEELAQFE
ncbi:MAG: molybdenum cofactor guanylyltransferase [Burkholderiaceae bacterium]|nr:molybdenum cofactor guanylyltransferase [Burkholderiaceae bacterium]